MTRVLVVLALLAFAGLLATPSPVGADHCGPGYGASYGGKSWWPGGYWPGGGGYNSGHYGAGYYSNYNSYSYAPKYVDDHVAYRRYVAVIPLVELPSYASYYVQPPVAAVAARPPAPMPAPAPPAPPAPSAADGKLDKLLAFAERHEVRLQTLESRVGAIETGARAPAPPPAPRAPAPAPAAAPGPDVSAVLGSLHSACASCHDAAVSAAKGGKLTLFVTERDARGQVTNAEMAKRDAAGKTVALEPAELRRMRASLADLSMPPPKAPPLPAEARKQAIDLLDRVLAGAPR